MTKQDKIKGVLATIGFMVCLFNLGPAKWSNDIDGVYFWFTGVTICFGLVTKYFDRGVR